MRFSLRYLLVFITAIAAGIALVAPILRGGPEIRWRPLSVAGLNETLEHDKAALILAEGHAGGRHQYVVVESQMNNSELKQFINQRSLITYRVNCLAHGLVWQEFCKAMAVPDCHLPCLIAIRKGHEPEIIPLDPNSSSEAILQSMRTQLSTSQ
jgi:hypothetical protein